MPAKDWELLHYSSIDKIPEHSGSFTSLYHTKAFLKARYPEIQTFICQHNNGNMLGKIHFVKENDRLISLPQLPFGSVDLSPDIQTELVRAFFGQILEILRTYNPEEIVIRHYISIYNPSFLLLEDLFKSHGFEQVLNEVSHYIEVDQTPLKDKIHAMEQRKIRRGKKLGLKFNEHPHTDLGIVYSFIEECRLKKKHKISMTYEQLQQVFTLFPEKYKIFSVSHENVLYAACIGLMSRANIFYYFMPASNPDYNSSSPMTFLLEALYEKGQKENWDYIDFGTSMLNENPNHSLIAFKERMSGIRTDKKTYRLRVNG